jgi:acyl-CoA reductase-like NAD-dependent aldehyde dehydrogenase
MKTDLFIAGTWREASNGSRIAVIDPAAGEEITTAAS